VRASCVGAGRPSEFGRRFDAADKASTSEAVQKHPPRNSSGMLRRLNSARNVLWVTFRGVLGRPRNKRWRSRVWLAFVRARQHRPGKWR
jgi:hypothetical protein